MPFTIITPTPGPSTAERVLELIITHPQGITVKGLSDRLNRPISMVQRCLKELQGSKFVQAKLNPEDRQWVYYPVASLEIISP